MTKLILNSDREVRVETDNNAVLIKVNNHFSPFIDGHWFNPKYKAGFWDGRIRFYNSRRQSIPLGLFEELTTLLRVEGIKFQTHKDLHEVVRKKDVFFNVTLPDFSLREFQTDCVQTLLQYGRGMARIATGGGKTATEIVLIKTLLENNLIQKALIIVPRIQLVEQFYKEFKVVGYNDVTVARLGGGFKEALNQEHEIAISTWQTLAALHNKAITRAELMEFLSWYQCVVVDEVHTAKAEVLSRILKVTPARWRFGFTATLPQSKKYHADYFSILSSIGPIRFEEGIHDLIKKDFLSPMSINIINVDWGDQKFENFQAEKKWLVNNSRRNKIVARVTKREADQNRNVLVLVERVEHGHELKKLLDWDLHTNNIDDEQVQFIHGNVPLEERERVREAVEEEYGMVIIATYGTFSLGINMKSLHAIVMASPGKSEIRTIQSIGRGLRKIEDKTHLTVWDIADSLKYAQRHVIIRKKIYANERFPFKEHHIGSKS